MGDSIELVRSDYYKLIPGSEGVFGIACIKINKLNILNLTEGEDENQRIAFYNILNEMYTFNNVSTSYLELLYKTHPADNQTYSADIDIYLVVRTYGDSEYSSKNLTEMYCEMITRILSNQKIDHSFVDPWELISEFEKISLYDASCLIKEEQIIGANIPISEYYYYVDYFKSEYDTEAYRQFIFQLSNYPDIAVSFQLSPYSFDDEEINSIMRVAELLDTVANGFQDDYYGEIKDYNARIPADSYSHFYSHINQASFTYNIAVYAPENVAVMVLNRIKSLINNNTAQESVPFIQRRIPSYDVDLYDGFINVTWRINNELTENYRSEFWYREDAPRSLMYLPYIVTIDEASVFFNLPCVTDETWPGIKVKEKVKERGRIDHILLDKDNIKIGFRPDDESVLIGIPSLELSKHMFIAGTPGTGKTNFSQYMLYQVLNKACNFIVIEPAKSEYRSLSKIIPDLQVFTVGKSDSVPLVINPFIPPKNVTAGTYKQELMDIFRAAFDMEGALENLFTETISSCYLKYGWRDNYTKDDNVKLFGLMEFIHEFERRMEGKYDGETRARLKTAGLTRLNKLIDKDFVMFDTIKTVSIEQLLEKPTVIELDNVGDTEQKSLVTTLLLNNLGSYIRANKDEFQPGRLNTLILLEEAHVIFSAAVTGEGRSAANSIAINLIERILKELRALGVGMIIADQSPQAVSSDVIKMTEHKMAFKTVEEYDRKILAGAMAMNEDMTEKMSILPVGRGYFFNTFTITPELLQTPDFRKEYDVPITISDAEVKQNNVYWKTNDNRPYEECEKCKMCSEGCDYNIRNEGRYIASRIMDEYFLSVKLEKDTTKKVFADFMDIAFKYADSSRLSENEIIKTSKCAAIYLLRSLYMKYDMFDLEQRIEYWKIITR